MKEGSRSSAFARFAWFVLGWNLLVILWGVFLRASKSGDGCGQHWLTCQGEVIPSAPALKTIIEFSHRMTSSLAGILIIVLLVWAYKRWRERKGAQDRLALRTAMASLFFVIVEGLLGAGLVLTGNTAVNLTPERPFWMAAHLVNTFILLALLTLTARYASGAARISLRGQGKYLTIVILGAAAVIVVGVTGSIAALSGMIFPAGTLSEGFASDFSPTSHVLLRLRLLHPITAVAASVMLVLLSGWLAKMTGREAGVSRWASVVSVTVVLQAAFGAATLLTLAPIVMQLGHLLLADLVWISYVMLAANFLSLRRLPAPEPETDSPDAIAMSEPNQRLAA